MFPVSNIPMRLPAVYNSESTLLTFDKSVASDLAVFLEVKEVSVRSRCGFVPCLERLQVQCHSRVCRHQEDRGLIFVEQVLPASSRSCRKFDRGG